MANPSSAGYSGKSISQKLGIKPGMKLHIINPPKNYMDYLRPIPEDVVFDKTLKPQTDLVHIFCGNMKELESQIFVLKDNIKPNGMIWVSWPKKASKVPTDITEDRIRSLVLPNGLVDVKVCAIDEIWSGLKLVIPVKDRG